LHLKKHMYEKSMTNSQQFLSLTSLYPSEFQYLLPIFEREYDEWSKHFQFNGKLRKNRYSPRKGGLLPSYEDKFFFGLVYLKNNPLQEYHAAAFNMQQDMCSKWLNVILPIIEKVLKPYEAKRQIHQLNQNLSKDETLIADCTERTVQRSSTDQEHFFSGKKKKHTLKNLLLINMLGMIVFLGATVEGKKHDKAVADEQGLSKLEKVTMLLDLGFQGLKIDGSSTKIMPHKKLRKTELSDQKKTENYVVSSVRVRVEHSIGGAKRLRIIKDTVRCHSWWFKDRVMVIATSLHNFRTAMRFGRLESASCASAVSYKFINS
jgi:hypothetical protein